MESLSPNQKRVLDFIEKYHSKNGHAPTYDVIAKGLGYAGKSSIQDFVKILVEKRYLTKQLRLSDGLTIHKDEHSLPLLGKVAAGIPIEHKKYDERVEVPLSMLRRPGEYFALQITGDSMIEEGILDGDYVVIEEQQEVVNGDIVVALLDNGLATLKKFYKEATRIRLEPANSKMQPIFATRVKVQGKCVGLIRKFAV
jgi:repressor LexA